MPRLRQVARHETDDELTLQMYDQLFGPTAIRSPSPGTATGTPGDWWTVFALVPDVLRHCVRGFALYRSPKRLLDPALRELGQTRAGWLRGSQFVFSQHCKSCRTVGISEEKIAAIPAWSVADVLRRPRAGRARLHRRPRRSPTAVCPTRCSTSCRTHLSDEEILELTYITAMYEMHAIMSKALRLEFDDRDDPIVEIAGDASSLAADVGQMISREDA